MDEYKGYLIDVYETENGWGYTIYKGFIFAKTEVFSGDGCQSEMYAHAAAGGEIDEMIGDGDIIVDVDDEGNLEYWEE